MFLQFFGSTSEGVKFPKHGKIFKAGSDGAFWVVVSNMSLFSTLLGDMIEFEEHIC